MCVCFVKGSNRRIQVVAHGPNLVCVTPGFAGGDGVSRRGLPCVGAAVGGPVKLSGVCGVFHIRYLLLWQAPVWGVAYKGLYYSRQTVSQGARCGLGGGTGTGLGGGTGTGLGGGTGTGLGGGVGVRAGVRAWVAA